MGYRLEQVLMIKGAPTLEEEVLSIAALVAASLEVQELLQQPPLASLHFRQD